jgi:hypothetical protein
MWRREALNILAARAVRRATRQCSKLFVISGAGNFYVMLRIILLVLRDRSPARLR